MKHIRYIPSVETNSYTIVISEGYGGENEPPLESHPSIVDHPELYEIIDCDIPEHHQYLIYQQ